MPLPQDLGAGIAVVMGKIRLNQFELIRQVDFTNEHRRRSDWNSGGTHGRTYYKSPAVEAKKHIFLHCNASKLVLKILQHDKIWGDYPPASDSGGLVPRSPLPPTSPPRDLRPCKWAPSFI